MKTKQPHHWIRGGRRFGTAEYRCLNCQATMYADDPKILDKTGCKSIKPLQERPTMTMRPQTKKKYAAIDAAILDQLKASTEGVTLEQLSAATLVQKTAVWRSCQRLINRGRVRSNHRKPALYFYRGRIIATRPPDAVAPPPAAVESPTKELVSAKLHGIADALTLDAVDTFTLTGPALGGGCIDYGTVKLDGYVLVPKAQLNTLLETVKFHNPEPAQQPTHSWMFVTRVGTLNGPNKYLWYCRKCKMTEETISLEPPEHRVGALCGF